MNEPRVIESVTNECQSLGRAHESSSARAEQLIACLEGEIAKQDARIVELDAVGVANEKLTQRIKELKAELAALKAQDTVGEVVGWYRLDRPYEMTSYPSVCATWHKLGAPVAPLYAAPAAPAADAGIVDMYRHLQKVTPYRLKKIQDASITDGGDVMYFHKDRFDAALLADMAAHCAAKGVV